MQNFRAFIFCFIGGALLLVESFATSIGMFGMLTALQSIPALAQYYFIIEILLYVLWLIAGLGGVSVIAGGFLLTRERVGTGKFIIGLGAGMSLIGLIIKVAELVWGAFLSGSSEPLIEFTFLVVHSIAWIGVFLSIIGRRVAKTSD